MSLVPPAGQGWASTEFVQCVQDFNTGLVAAYRRLVPEHDLAVIDHTVMAQGTGCTASPLEAQAQDAGTLDSFVAGCS